MALRQIIYSDNPVLREKSRRIPQPDEEIEHLVADMFETMRAANDVGLAAVQVNVPLRVIIAEIPEDLDDPGRPSHLRRRPWPMPPETKRAPSRPC